MKMHVYFFNHQTDFSACFPLTQSRRKSNKAEEESGNVQPMNDQKEGVMKVNLLTTPAYLAS